MKKKPYILFILLLFFSACTERNNPTSIASQNVLTYYSDSITDNYKLRAAQFLIENMDVQYTLKSESIDSFRLYMIVQKITTLKLYLSIMYSCRAIWPFPIGESS